MFKKLIGAVLVLSVSMTFCGCDFNKDTETVTSTNASSIYSVNILAYAEKGEIPEVPFAVGADVETVKSGFKETLQEGSEVEDLTIDEGETTVWMDGGSSMFCYEKANESAGVGVIIAKEYAYNLSMGGVYTVEDVIEAVGSEEYVRGTATKEDAFFLPVLPEGTECVKYTAGDYVLRFVAIDEIGRAHV